MTISRALEYHRKLRGKITVEPKRKVKDKDDLSLAYTPGVAEASLAIAKDRKEVYNLTGKWNSVAIVTDGTAVLGLGDIGPEAALPVMEGKAVLFKEFAGIDAYPICLKTKDVEEIVETIVNISSLTPSSIQFLGLSLEEKDEKNVTFRINATTISNVDLGIF